MGSPFRKRQIEIWILWRIRLRRAPRQSTTRRIGSRIEFYLCHTHTHKRPTMLPIEENVRLGWERNSNKHVNECNSTAVMRSRAELWNIFFLLFSFLLRRLCSITLRAHLLHSIELQHFMIIIISTFLPSLLFALWLLLLLVVRARSVYARMLIFIYLFAFGIRAVVWLFYLCYSTDDKILLLPLVPVLLPLRLLVFIFSERELCV